MNRMYNAKVLPLLCAICLLASCHHPSYWNNSGTWGRGPGTMGWFGPFGMVIFWVIAVIVLIALVRWIMGTGRGISNNGGSKA